MFAALILVISGAMLAQFAVFFWRANMLATAAQPISERLGAAELSFTNAMNQSDFSTLTAMSEICPKMGDSRGIRLWPVQTYHCAMRLVVFLCDTTLPKAGAWARREMAICTKYVAVLMDLRLQANQNFIAELRAY